MITAYCQKKPNNSNAKHAVSPFGMGEQKCFRDPPHFTLNLTKCHKVVWPPWAPLQTSLEIMRKPDRFWWMDSIPMPFDVLERQKDKKQNETTYLWFANFNLSKTTVRVSLLFFKLRFPLPSSFLPSPSVLSRASPL